VTIYCMNVILQIANEVARGSVVGWGTMLQAGRSRVRFPMRSLDCSRTMALGSTQPLKEMSTRNLPGGLKGGWRVRLTTLPPSVSRLSRENVGASTFTTLWAFAVCYRDSFTFYLYNRLSIISEIRTFNLNIFPPAVSSGSHDGQRRHTYSST
jgi:hypothetical protein